MFPLAAARYPDLPERPRVLVPVGATEQHGPHLPLSTDTVIATAVAQRAGERTGSWVAPAIAFGASGEHQGFPGVFSVGTRVLTEMIIELTRSLTLWAGEVVFVNGHGGNVAALRTAVETLRAQRHDVRWLPCAVEGDAHAGYAETSIMLHLAPGDVALTEAVAGNVEPLPELMDRLRRNGVRAVSPNGVLGDPAGASARAGAELVDRMVQRIVDELR
ncbi:mycofactocin biosynthesis peptidyl-dipeptidase MftE [Nocardia vaccinii]|uniref:mycofactocin biosynthesis peptidyl-dipeptidase MftE n=1 Tax=Nocardia vaccinii TaxID=1822 RepID=UPI00082E54C7|nr:mycofactocin biosynthesis peptidyl-dipeptidase MftE [Nocardia vaccinii]